MLTNSSASQLLSGEGIKTDFMVEGVETDETPESELPGESEEETDGEAKNDEKPARETVMFDAGLNCGSCEDRVTDTLDERDGVREIHADADEQRVEVTFNPHRITTDELRETIADLGYEVGSVEGCPASSDSATHSATAP